MRLSIHREQVTERLARLTDAYLDQSIEKELFEERKTTLLLERKAIMAASTDLEQNRRSVPDELERFLELAGSAFSLYGKAPVEEKRELLKTVTSNLMIDHKTLDFAFVTPFREVANREISADGRPSKGMDRTWNALIEYFSRTRAENCESIPAIG